MSWFEVIQFIDTYLSYLLIFFLITAGLFFTVSLRFLQFKHFGHMFTVLKDSRRADASGLSSYQAFCTSMASRVGTGNVAGIALAITLGGPGAVFWMWLIALIGTATSFAESSLAQVYKCRDSQGQYRGGPSYYMAKGLNAPKLGIFFSFLLIITYGFAFNAVQANTIGLSLQSVFNIPTWISGIAIALFTAAIIAGGLRKVAKTSELLVPLMALLYLTAAFVIVVTNLSRLPEVIGFIFRGAFGLQEFTAGGLGAAIVHGIKRGLFSNEAGMGSAPNIAASATPYPPHPASQGYVQMVGVFIDTFVICTASAAIVLLSGVPLEGSVTGIQLIELALGTQFGGWSAYFLAIIILFFAFTSIIANYSYAENCMLYLKKGKSNNLYGLKTAVVLMVFLGTVATLPQVWSMADITMSLMAITNIIAILLLSPLTIKLAKDYNQQRNEKKLPVFHLKDYPEIRDQVEPGVWN